MFEHSYYYFELATLKIFSFYFFYINFGFFLLGSIGWFVEKVTKVDIPSAGKILVGYVVYSIMAWWLYKTGNARVIWLAPVPFAVYYTGNMIMAWKRNKLEPIPIFLISFNVLNQLSPLFITEFVLIIFWSGFLNHTTYHILASGNNDVYFWPIMSDHVMGISDLGRINFGEDVTHFLGDVIDCFGSHSWLGLMAKISLKSHSIEAVMLFQLSLLILSAWLVYEISSVVIGVTWKAAFIPAFVFSFNPLWLYIFTNSFFPQLVATFCFLGFIFIFGSSAGYTTSKHGTIFWGFIFYSAFLFAYPGLLIPYFAFMIASVCTFTFFTCRATGCSPPKEMITMLACFFIGIWMGSVLFFDITSNALNRFIVYSKSANNGWPLSMLDPFNLIGLISYSLHKTFFSNWITYFLLLLLMSSVFLARYITNKTRSIRQARYDSLLFLSIMSLMGYMGVYFFKGTSYQQWKFATYFPLPLLIITVVNYYAPKRNA